MYRFVLQPRWLAGHLFVLAVMIACVQLGQWQWHRHEQRSAHDAQLSANLAADPVPLSELGGRPVDARTEWRAVTVRGTYDTAGSVLVRNRTHDGPKGYDVLVPLVTGSGEAVVVNRGWVPASGAATARVDVPPPPEGQVSVTGRLRASERAAGPDEAGVVRGPQPSVLRIDPAVVEDLVGRPLLRGYVQATEESPAPATSLTPIGEPGRGGGRNLAYSLQWYVFAAVALGGWVLLLRREAHDLRHAADTARTPAPV
ncbi:MAG: SURF1 family protein [Actinomycetota bacterium]|nr:SURF1 family protein [Actinomycetota bacterium]